MNVVVAHELEDAVKYKEFDKKPDFVVTPVYDADVENEGIAVVDGEFDELDEKELETQAVPESVDMPSETLVRGDFDVDPDAVNSIVGDCKAVIVLPELFDNKGELLLVCDAVRQRVAEGDKDVNGVTLLKGVKVPEAIPEKLSVADTESDNTVEIVDSADVVAVFSVLDV